MKDTYIPPDRKMNDRMILFRRDRFRVEIM